MQRDRTKEMGAAAVIQAIEPGSLPPLYDYIHVTNLDLVKGSDVTASWFSG